MKNIYLILTSLIFIISYSCKNKSVFPIEKRYWDTDDYSKVVKKLKYGYNPDEKLPSFQDPKTSIIVKKLTDHDNFNVILEDSELGLSYRDNFADSFFTNLNTLNRVYRATNRKDEYLYEFELLAVDQFLLDFYLKSFKVGKLEILEMSDDPDSNQTKQLLSSNLNILIQNFNNYLNEIKSEKSFSEKGKNVYAEGIDKYFPILIEQYPNASFSSLKTKIDLMHKKTKSERIKTSLAMIKQLIEGRKKKIDLVLEE